MYPDITIDQCPIFKPTQAEFENFSEYLEKLENKKNLSDYGMVKVTFLIVYFSIIVSIDNTSISMASKDR